MNFSTKEARAELARIDANWSKCSKSGSADFNFHDLRAAYIRALDAIDAGWEFTDADVVEAAVAGWEATNRENTWITISAFKRNERLAETRAALTSVGRSAHAPAPPRPMLSTDLRQLASYIDEIGKLPSFATLPWLARVTDEAADAIDDRRDDVAMRLAARIAELEAEKATRAPSPITDAMVEEAAERAYAAPDGKEGSSEETRRNEVRAVLEWAATRNLAPIAATAPPTPDDGRAKRLTRYRCAILGGYAANEVAMVQVHEDFADHKQWPEFNVWQASHVETLAHAMLAAERSPARG